MLLLCRGIGRRAMVKSVIVGLSYGCFTWLCISLWFASTDSDISFVDEIVGTIAYDIWTVSELFIFIPMWLMPNKGIFIRRPAAIYWGRFFGLMRFALALCQLFEIYDLDFGYCLQEFFSVIIFCGFRGKGNVYDILYLMCIVIIRSFIRQVRSFSMYCVSEL